MFFAVMASVIFSSNFALAKKVDKDYKDWHLSCRDINEKEVCKVSQTMVKKDEKSKKVARIFSLDFIYSPANKKTVMSLALPVGVALQKGAGIVVTGSKKGVTGLKYNFCMSNGCYINAPVDAEVVKLFKASDTADLIFYNVMGQAVSTKISFSGYTAAMNALYKRMK